MEIQIAVRHGQLEPGEHTHIQDRANKLKHFFNRLNMITATVDLENPLAKTVEVLVSAEHKHDFVAHETHSDLKMAIDQAFHKVEEQLRRYKEKIQDHRRTPHAGQAGSPPEALGTE
jgi:putative sigma-54 modulation protein